MKKRIVLSVIIALSVLMLISCSPDTQPIEPTQPPVEESQPTDVPPTEPPPSPTNTSVPEPTAVPPTETPLPEPTQAPTFEPLPPEPQEIDFEAEDGQVLHGRYYPAAVNPAPVLVLMHWARGDMNDWNEIAFWLQNRGLAGTSLNAGTAPWLTPDWFPPMFEGQSFAVFTFTFRGCAGRCSFLDKDGWRMDALAAMQTARELEGVDPARVATFGASIGADGSPDACGPLNVEFSGTCLGALSLSPGNYLNVPYADAVEVLDYQKPPSPVWCVYATGDKHAADTCKSATGDHYERFEWAGDYHGMDLLRPDIEPNTMQLILDWLALLFDL
ncbi:MAG: hypothetical protein DRI56_02250 [Chloroflexota bacterium]|nr:MAG: hypothetical protein DRI56_02250 [Chloroflexota bacterium]